MEQVAPEAHLWMGAVHGHDAEVIGYLRRRVSSRWRFADNWNGRPRQGLGGSDALIFVGFGVEAVHNLQRMIQPLELAGLLGAQVVGHALYLDGSLSQVKGHDLSSMCGTLFDRQLVAVERYAPFSEP